MWTFFEIFINFIQSSMILYFLHKQLSGFKSNLLAPFLCVSLLTFFLSIYIFVDIPVLDTIGFLIPLIYSLFFFRDKWYTVLFWNGTIILLTIGIATLTSQLLISVFNLNPESIYAPTSERVSFVLISNILLFSAILFTVRLSNRYAQPPVQAFFLLTILNLLYLILMEIFYVSDKQLGTDIYTLICLILLSCSILSIVIYEIMSKNAEIQKNNELYLHNLKLKQQYYNEEKSMYSALSILCHDMKHYLQLISNLTSYKNNNIASSYAASLSEKTSQFLQPSTGNIAVDAIIMAKVINMKSHGINLKIQSYFLDQLPIEESDFCVLLGNILDNASEGALRIPHHENICIELKLARSWEMLFITCTNPCDPNQLYIQNGMYVSSKRSLNHGIGLQSIKAIVEKASGQYNHSVANNEFKIEIMLPFCSKLKED